MQNEKPLYGIKGWLLFFCICTCFLSPLWFTFKYVSALPLIPSQLLPREVRVYLVASLVIESLVTIFGLFAGIMLWRKRSFAVTLAEIYLVCRPVSVVILWIVEWNLLSSKSPPTFIFGSIIWTAIWFAYLETSERVRNTFKKNSCDWPEMELEEGSDAT